MTPCRKTITLSLLALATVSANAQRIVYETTSETTIHLNVVYNDDPKYNAEVIIDGSKATIAKSGSLHVEKECRKSVMFRVNNPNGSVTKTIWSSGDTAEEWRRTHPADNSNQIEEVDVAQTDMPSTQSEQKKETPKSTVVSSAKTKRYDAGQITKAFVDYLEQDSFLSTSNKENIATIVQQYLSQLEFISDQELRQKCIRRYNMDIFADSIKRVVDKAEKQKESFVNDFISERYPNMSVSDRIEVCGALGDTLQYRLDECNEILKRLHTTMTDDSITAMEDDFISRESAPLYIIGVILVLFVLVLVMVRIKRHKRNTTPTVFPGETAQRKAQGDIIVRRKTTSILKKQSLEDVQNNNAYYPIDCADFCEDSAVRRIYVKNTCVKDIYNLYAEDLRNPDNPNEDGCMVLGRWVYDNEYDEYYVSLEEIVRPGDDAVFQEYELNFGGKIKLKVFERLRRLRRETNLQYDMTCWVHSHPGLGVFFSNADNNVHLQLKHPTHPKFLVAFVIDILTPQQELGIFTFKHDMTINSRAELTKMYSLEELYKWAVESDRNSFRPEDYYNMMRAATSRLASHNGVELSNGAVIDICQMEAEKQAGSSAWAHGFVSVKNGKTEYVVNAVSKSSAIPDNEPLGYFLSGTHCSIPTIRKTIGANIQGIHFVLFYSSTDGMLTTIPVVDGILSVEEKNYGEQKLEDLKIWTRRKR